MQILVNPYSILTKLGKVQFLICCVLKFIYSEKATKFCKISTLLLTSTTYLGQK